MKRKRVVDPAAKAKAVRRAAIAATKRDAIPRIPIGDTVRRLARSYGLGRDEMARWTGDAASQMSRLMTGHDEEFSADRTVGFLLALGHDVTLTIHERRGIPSRKPKRGRCRVVAEKET